MMAFSVELRDFLKRLFELEVVKVVFQFDGDLKLLRSLWPENDCDMVPRFLLDLRRLWPSEAARSGLRGIVAESLCNKL